MPESFENQLSRVEGMASGDPTWDLSPNDQAALKSLLVVRNRQALRISELDAEVRRLRTAVKRIDETLRVPAAEYVPAISDVFAIIDKIDA